MIQIIVRLIITGALLFFVYQETGWATTLCLALVTLTLELQAMALNKITGRF